MTLSATCGTTASAFQGNSGLSGRAAPSDDDVHAMAAALAKSSGDKGDAKIGGREGPGALLTTVRQGKDGKQAPSSLQQRAFAEAKGRQAEKLGIPGYEGAEAEGALEADSPLGITKRRYDDAHDGEGFGLAGQASATTATATPATAPNSADTAAFAEVVDRLWALAKRKDKEVRVSFGADAWPATGARMVQSDDGLLDIEVQVANGDRSLDLAGLGQGLAERGLAVGTLSIAPRG